MADFDPEERLEFAHFEKREGDLRIKQLVARAEVRDEANQLQIIPIGKKNSKPTKTILLIGETGAGKTTFLNALINCLIGVKFEDDFRYAVKDETGTEERELTESQTEFVTGYLLYYKPGMEHDCNFLIIDTPGLSDTRGKTQQKKIRAQIELFLRDEKFNVELLHSLCFVIKGNTNRSLLYIKDIIDEFNYLFGTDTKLNTNVIATFTLNRTSVDKLLQNVVYTKMYKIDNEYIFSKFQDDEFMKEQAERCWTEIMKRYQIFIEDVKVAQPASLHLTKVLCEQKMKCEENMNDLQRYIKEQVRSIVALDSQQRSYDKYMDCQKRNERFTLQEKVSRPERKAITGTFTHAHNCPTCNVTCIFPCYTMGILIACLRYGNCENCSCSLWSHERANSRIVYKLITQNVTDEDMKKRFEDAKNKAQSVAEAKKSLEAKCKKCSSDIVKSMTQILTRKDTIDSMTRNANLRTKEEFINEIFEDIYGVISREMETKTDRLQLSNIIDALREEIDKK